MSSAVLAPAHDDADHRPDRPTVTRAEETGRRGLGARVVAMVAAVARAVRSSSGSHFYDDGRRWLA